MTKDILLHEIADAIVNHREDVIDKLNYSNIPTESGIAPEALAKRVMDNLNNKKFLYGLSLVVAKKNKDEFENFMVMSSKQNKGQKINVIGDVATEMTKITTADKDELNGRVATYSKENPIAPEARGQWVWGVGFVSISVLLMYLVYTYDTKKSK